MRWCRFAIRSWAIFVGYMALFVRAGMIAWAYWHYGVYSGTIWLREATSPTRRVSRPAVSGDTDRPGLVSEGDQAPNRGCAAPLRLTSACPGREDLVMPCILGNPKTLRDDPGDEWGS